MLKPMTNHPPLLVAEDVRCYVCVCMQTILGAAAATICFHCTLINKPGNIRHESSMKVELMQCRDYSAGLKRHYIFYTKVSGALLHRNVSNCVNIFCILNYMYIEK